MMRFVRGLGVTFAATVIVGGAVVAVVPADGDAGTDAAASIASQTEDAEGEPEGDGGVPGVTLTPVEAYLAAVLPRATGEPLPSGQRIILSRDPFEPVIVEVSGGTDGGGTDGGGTDGGGTDGGGTDGGGTDGGGTDGGGTDGGGTDPRACSGSDDESVCDGIVVTLDGFDEAGNAIVTVDGTRHIVGRGDEFAESFEVLAIDQPCATFLYGDEAFTICTGVTVLK